eukprot:m.108092 g.108092  ORF g.108092 m.108092 type:complete len:105 (+) comp15204_c0_seq10:146-460(+)
MCVKYSRSRSFILLFFATSSGVSPLLFFASRFAPYSIKRRATSIRPSLLASCNGVTIILRLHLSSAFYQQPRDIEMTSKAGPMQRSETLLPVHQRRVRSAAARY